MPEWLKVILIILVIAGLGIAFLLLAGWLWLWLVLRGMAWIITAFFAVMFAWGVYLIVRKIRRRGRDG